MYASLKSLGNSLALSSDWFSGTILTAPWIYTLFGGLSTVKHHNYNSVILCLLRIWVTSIDQRFYPVKLSSLYAWIAWNLTNIRDMTGFMDTTIWSQETDCLLVCALFYALFNFLERFPPRWEERKKKWIPLWCQFWIKLILVNYMYDYNGKTLLTHGISQF